MESSTETNTTTTTTTTSSTLGGSNSPTSSSSPPSTPNPNPPIVISPCAACKILRRRCADKCVLAPYFPPTDPAKFTIAHRVFGASNIIKFLQELPESQRADAVSSMVYEASARIRDPVYGCAGAICHLQKQLSELQAQLAKAQAEAVSLQCQQANLVALICMEVAQSQQGYNSNYDSTLHHHHQQQQQQTLDGSFMINNNNTITATNSASTTTTTPTSLMITNNQNNINSLSFLEDNTNLGPLWELWT